MPTQNQANEKMSQSQRNSKASSHRWKGSSFRDNRKDTSTPANERSGRNQQFVTYIESGGQLKLLGTSSGPEAKSSISINRKMGDGRSAAERSVKRYASKSHSSKSLNSRKRLGSSPLSALRPHTQAGASPMAGLASPSAGPNLPPEGLFTAVKSTPMQLAGATMPAPRYDQVYGGQVPVPTQDSANLAGSLKIVRRPISPEEYFGESLLVAQPKDLRAAADAQGPVHDANLARVQGMASGLQVVESNTAEALQSDPSQGQDVQPKP